MISYWTFWIFLLCKQNNDCGKLKPVISSDEQSSNGFKMICNRKQDCLKVFQPL